MSNVTIVPVNAANVHEVGFFCYKSARKSPGYRDKRAWLEQRFGEGLRLLLATDEGRPVGFIEYIPGEYAWRAVEAPGYMVIHCLWVVGRDKGKGYGSALLEACVSDARAAGLSGVAVVTGKRTWLADQRLFHKHGFQPVDQAPPSFALQALRFGQAVLPAFPKDWDDRSQAFGPGLTVVTSGQCPYFHKRVSQALEKARERGLRTNVVTFVTAQQARAMAPTPYGVCGLVLDGRLLSYYYSWPKA